MSNYRRIQDRSRYRKSFFFVTEGAASEEAYLKIVWNRLGLREYCNARFCHEKSSIPAMLATAKKVEKDSTFNPRKGDELWIILDYDEQCHFPEQFKELAAWEDEKPRTDMLQSPHQGLNTGCSCIWMSTPAGINA